MINTTRFAHFVRLFCAASVASLVFALPTPLCGQEQDWIQSWVFNGRTEKSVRERFEITAGQKIEQLNATCGLSEQQVAKLKLAAAGDISRFFHEVAKIRVETAGFNMQDQNAVQQAWQVISPLAARVQKGIFEGDSLLNKVIQTTLDDTQRAEYQRVIDEQIQRRHHAIVLSTVASIEVSLPLLAAQREKLIELMDKQDFKGVELANGLESYLGYKKLNQISDQELAAFLDKEQLATLKQVLQKYDQLFQMIR